MAVLELDELVISGLKFFKDLTRWRLKGLVETLFRPAIAPSGKITVWDPCMMTI